MARLVTRIPKGSFVWSATEGADLYLATGLKPASRHFYVTADELTAVPRLYDEVVGDFQRTPPTLLVLPASWVDSGHPNYQCPKSLVQYMAEKRFRQDAYGPKSTIYFTRLQE